MSDLVDKTEDGHIRIYYNGLYQLFLDKQVTPTEYAIGTSIYRHSYKGQSWAAVVEPRSWATWEQLIPVSNYAIRKAFDKFCKLGILYKLYTPKKQPTTYIRFREPLTYDQMLPYIERIEEGETYVDDKLHGLPIAKQPSTNGDRPQSSFHRTNETKEISPFFQEYVDRNGESQKNA